MAIEQITESIDLEYASVEEGSTLLKDVLLCGNQSKNGYNIPSRAFGSESNTKALYEGKPVFFNHAPGSNGVLDTAGVVVNVRLKDGKPRGDLETADWEMGQKLIKILNSKKIQESGLKLGMSHVARYRFDDDRTSVEEVVEVLSVDVVHNPATTKTFKEHKTEESPMAEKPDAVDLLTKQLETAQDTIKKLETASAEQTQTVSKLEAGAITLQEGLDAAVATNKEFEAKQAEVDASAERAKELTDSDLKPEHVSDAFKAAYVATESADTRKSLLADRLEVFKDSGPASSQRKAGSESQEETKTPDSWAREYNKENGHTKGDK